jgi:putative membrane protein
MPELQINKMEKTDRLLILAADIDNDLYRKTKISGPVMGRVQNLNAANQMVLSDPEDTDGNTIFQAVKLYDELKKSGYIVNVALITGSETEGYDADKEISRQLDLVLKTYKADACIFVTDGASDNRILPIVQSRIKINGVKNVTMKQAEKLENTYFVIFEKLKEPHYARIIFGIPAILLMLFAISYALGLSWEAPVGLIGIYLILKGFGIENAVIESFKDFGFSFDKMSFALYFSSLIFFVAALFIAYGSYANAIQITSNMFTVYALTLEGFLLLFPIFLILYQIGRMIDVKDHRYMFRSFKFGNYISSSIMLWIILYLFVAWIMGQIYFSQFFPYTLFVIIVGLLIIRTTMFIKKRVISRKRLKNKLVINELGALIGKVSAVDIKHGMIKVHTSFGTVISYNIDRITDINDKIIIR